MGTLPAGASSGKIIISIDRAGRPLAGRDDHVGAPPTLQAATAALLDWAAERDLSWDMSETDSGEQWGCRLEIYLTDPAKQSDVNKWETQLAFRLAD